MTDYETEQYYAQRWLIPEWAYFPLAVVLVLLIAYVTGTLLFVWWLTCVSTFVVFVFMGFARLF